MFCSRTLRTLALAAACLGAVTPAFAHAHLLSSIPASHAKAPQPLTELRLKFSEAIELTFTKVKLTSATKAVIETGAATLAPQDDTVLIVPLASPLPAGTYTVDWQALSTDGHKTKGSYGFESMK